jgi:hypothetical protein
MSWNYRMMAQKDGDNYFFSVHEVYYDKNNIPYSYSKEPVSVNGNSVDDLIFGVNAIKGAILNRPVLWYGNRFPEVFDYDKLMK